MKNFFKDPKLKLSQLKDLDRDVLIYRVLPYFLLEIMSKYFRLEVEGIENVPQRGPAIIAPNHSGYSGFDSFLLSHSIYQNTRRIPRVLTHHFWFISPLTAIPANKVGFVEATKENGRKALKKNQLVILFPEGEYGNFKPTTKRYHLQEFRRGFVRLALEQQCPIIPTLVLGAEETHINLKQIKLSKYLMGTILPLPLNVLPLPAKWKIRFLPPITLPFKPEAANDAELVHEITMDIRERIQSAIAREVKNRHGIFAP